MNEKNDKQIEKNSKKEAPVITDYSLSLTQLYLE